MAINADKPHLWKVDAERSIDLYNDWFIRFAPETFRTQRAETTDQVTEALRLTDFLRDISVERLRANPGILPILRMACAPPLARDRLIGLAHLNRGLVSSMEGASGSAPRIPPRMPAVEQFEQLQRICDTIIELADRDLFVWLDGGDEPAKEQYIRAAMVVADRLCGAAADPIIRNAQERRQLETIGAWLSQRGYANVLPASVEDVLQMPPGTFSFRMNVRVGEGQAAVNLPVDCVIQPHHAQPGDIPVLVEAKSAGDATNTNKRRKEEAQKYHQLLSRFGPTVRYVLLLCGYFEPGYLGYEASEGIDWIWEHRLSDLDVLLADHARTQYQVGEGAPVYTALAGAKEQQRFVVQKQTDAKRTQVQRNQMGQFSTPFLLAQDIVAYTLEQFELAGHKTIRFLEPALGTGVFFSALESRAQHTGIELATGVELDDEYARVAADLWPESPWEVEYFDFAAFSALPEKQNCYNLLCTNPPYVRHHHLSSERKLDLQQRVMRLLHLHPSGLSGLYVYFVLLAHGLLKPNGVASWLIPSEFLAVNYGQVLREYLLRRVTLKRIHQFDPADVQFDDALVSSCVVTYLKQPPTQAYEFEFTYGGTLAEPRQVRRLTSDTVSSREKWSFNGMGTTHAGHPQGVRLGDLFDVKRGIATGANDYFIIGSSTIEEYDLPRQFLKPVLPSPRYINESVIRADKDGFPTAANARYLLDCNLPPDQVRAQYPNLWRYLAYGEAQGVPDGYLCANRKPWYLQEQRSAALFMATYMTRSRSGSASPFRFFLNLSQAIGTNVFLLLYPKPVLKSLLAGRDERLFELLDVLNGLAEESVVREGRTYGGGLHKLEPRELANLRLEKTPEWLQLYTQLSLTVG